MHEINHLWSHLGETLVTFFAGGATWTVIAYAAQTFPVPQNPYARWFVSIIQFAVANRNKVEEIKQKPAEGGQ